MSKCDNCEVRKVYAKLFDMHWMGEDDCPVECKEEDGQDTAVCKEEEVQDARV